VVEVLIIETIVEAAPLGYLLYDVADIALAASATMLVVHNFVLVHILDVNMLDFLLKLVIV
jgi:hypothetical protein